VMWVAIPTNLGLRGIPHRHTWQALLSKVLLGFRNWPHFMCKTLLVTIFIFPLLLEKH
jgi:hypothetical protein